MLSAPLGRVEPTRNPQHPGRTTEFCLSRRYVAIIAGELIEHLTNPETFLNCAIEHLNPSGRIRMVGRLMSTFGRILNSRMGFNNMLFALRREASEEVFTHSHVEAS